MSVKSSGGCRRGLLGYRIGASQKAASSSLSVKRSGAPVWTRRNQSPPHIKEEQEELWTSQEGEQLPGLEEADIIKFTLSPVPVKSEDDEENQCSKLHPGPPEENRETEPLASTSAGQMETEAGGEHSGGSTDPAGGPEPSGEAQLLSSDWSGTEGDDREDEHEEDWKEIRLPQSGLSSRKSQKAQRAEGQRPSFGDNKPSNDLTPRSQAPPSFSCKVCGISFSSRSSLMGHFRGHSRQCGLCGKHLEPSESREFHFELHKKCNVCWITCRSYAALESHMRSHSGEKLCKKPFRCTICEDDFFNSGCLKQHMKIHRGERSSRGTSQGSDIIAFTFNPVPVKSEEEDEESRCSQLHPGQPEENRETAPLASTSAGQMETEAGGEHSGGSTDPAGGPEPSSECQPLSSDWSGTEGEDDDDDDEISNTELSNDLTPRNQTPPSSVCKVCGESFLSKKSLMNHIRIHLEDCGLCGKHLEASLTLKDHFEVHKKCNFCGITCKSFSVLENHTRVHTGEKPFACKVCGKCFTESGSLKTHTRIHTGEKPFRCKICEQSFTQTFSLQVHMRIHTRPFRCKVCKDGFTCQRGLNRHMRIHSGERPPGLDKEFT